MMMIVWLIDAFVCLFLSFLEKDVSLLEKFVSERDCVAVLVWQFWLWRLKDRDFGVSRFGSFLEYFE